jgi:secreted trypsin-like serine protease
MIQSIGSVRSQVRWFLAVTPLALFASGCAIAASDESEGQTVAVETAELKNGSLYDGNEMWRGVVRLLIQTPPYGAWNTCSGQVVSRQTIMTAAHCVKGAVGLGENPGASNVRVWRESPTGQVVVMPQTWVMMEYNPAYSNDSAVDDVGLIHAPTVQPLQNVTSADSAVLAKTTPSNVTMYAFGFGYYNSTQIDWRGRYGAIVPTYATKAVEYFWENTGTAPEQCAGDSGGPIKSATSGSVQVYALHSRRSGGTGLCQPVGHAPATARAITWLRNNIVGSCQETATTLKCW